MRYILLLIFLLLSVNITYARTATIIWGCDNCTDEVIDYYILYWGESSRVYTNHQRTVELERVLTVTIPDEGVFYFAVTSIDKSGIESDYSNEFNTVEHGQLNTKPLKVNGILIL